MSPIKALVTRGTAARCCPWSKTSPQSRLPESPVAGAHSIWELTLHIANWNEAIVRRLAGEEVEAEIDSEGDWPRIVADDADAWKQTVERLKRSYEVLRDALNAASDDRLAQNATNRKYSNYVMAHGIIHHIVYHSGQIGLLRKALAEPKR